MSDMLNEDEPQNRGLDVLGERAHGRIVAGAMSGTSADGVDVAVVDVTGRGEGMSARLRCHHHHPYDTGLRRALFAVRESGKSTLAALAQLARDVARAYAQAVNAALAGAGVAAHGVAAVAAHGQTLFHDPPCTIQWIDPALLAAETRCTVVSDFRRADCAAGGQGAPLVPFADYVLFRDPARTRVLLNLGGIANVTHLPAGRGLDHVVAFDTGPGNCVCDHLMRRHDPAGPGYDAGGAAAARGIAVAELVHGVLAHPYFSRPPPKSTDGPAMIDACRAVFDEGGRRYPFANLMRTACQITATAAADAIRRLDPSPDELIVSGGGVHNAVMMDLLRRSLGSVPVRTTDQLGIPAAAKEAIAFALLGAATLDGLPSNVPSATGAKRPVVLGSVTPRP